MQFGSYKYGHYYVSVSDVPPYFDDVLKDMVGLIKGIGLFDVSKTAQIVSCLHETNHLIHDLYLGTYLNIDYMLDEAWNRSQQLFQTLKTKSSIPIPINQESLSTAERWLYEEIVAAHEKIENALSTAYPIYTSGEEDPTYLSGTDIIECVTVLKTMYGFNQMIEKEEHVAYINDIIEDVPLMFEQLPANYYAAYAFFEKHIQLTPGYFGRNRHWHDFQTNSNFLLNDTAFFIVSEVAFHVPPIYVIQELVRSGRNTEEDFLPVFRFARIVSLINRHPGFPPHDAANPIPFFGQFYNWVADNLGWPDFNNTEQDWHNYLMHFRETRGWMADGYKFRVYHSRYEVLNTFFHRNPYSLFEQNALPLFVFTTNGLRSLRYFGSLVSFYPFDGFPVDWLPDRAVKKWENAPQGSPANVVEELEKATSFLNEIITRTMNRFLIKKIIGKEENAACPWCYQGCSSARPACQRLTTLKHVETNVCILKKYLESQLADPQKIHFES